MRRPFNRATDAGAAPAIAVPMTQRGAQKSGRARAEAIAAYIFISPWLIGAVVFTFGPIIASLYYSLTDYNVLQPAHWVGLANYKEIFTQDDLFRKSLVNSLYYTVHFIPLPIVIALLIAMLLNTKVRGLSAWRTFFYLPVITPVVAAAVLWRFLLNPQDGIVDQTLRAIGLPAPGWTTDPAWLIRSVVLMVTWQAVGSTMILYLAGLRGIPVELYEAADLDGASWWSKTRNVTLPLLSPVIFYTLIIGVVGSIQVFAQPRILLNDENGGAGSSGLTYMMYLFNNAFSYFKMGYASALAWILFLVILAITAVQFWGGKHWVYYEGESR
jgi:multiple sugar transport system permease protein